MTKTNERGNLEFLITFILVAVSLYMLSYATLMVGLLIGMIFNYKKIREAKTD